MEPSTSRSWSKGDLIPGQAREAALVNRVVPLERAFTHHLALLVCWRVDTRTDVSPSASAAPRRASRRSTTCRARVGNERNDPSTTSRSTRTSRGSSQWRGFVILDAPISDASRVPGGSSVVERVRTQSKRDLPSRVRPTAAQGGRVFGRNGAVWRLRASGAFSAAPAPSWRRHLRSRLICFAEIAPPAYRTLSPAGCFVAKPSGTGLWALGFVDADPRRSPVLRVSSGSSLRRGPAQG